MKKKVVLFILASCFVAMQACETKKAKEEKSTEPAVEAKAMPTKEEKKAMKEQVRLATIEKRKGALEERLKKGIYFTDSNNKIVYWKSEIEPSFPGGEEALTTYLNKTIKYPKEASENGDEGTVFVDFIVSESGQVRDVTVNDESSEREDSYLRDEAIRVVKSMPLWKPGKQQGKPVSFNLPITFRLD